MAFSTLVFPFVFLPVSLILYFVLKTPPSRSSCSSPGTPEYLVLMVLTSRSTILRAVSWRFRKRAAGAGGSCSSRPCS